MNKKAVDLLAKLIHCRSTHSQSVQIKFALEFLKAEFTNDFLIRSLRVGGKPILIFSNVKGNNYDFIFAGHIDVVRAEESEFTVKTKGDQLYGRGALDMKGPLVAGLFAIRDWLKSAKRNLRVGIIISADEETGGASMNALLSSGRYKAKFALLPDGGNENEIITHQKGFMQLKLTVYGECAHASTPHEGDNPIEKVMALYQHLHKKFPQPRDELDWQTSIVLTKIESGDCLNQVPDYATAWLDIRYIKNGHKQKIFSEIKKYLGKTVECAVVAEKGEFTLDHNNIYLNKLATSIKKVTGRPVKLLREAGSSDAVFFSENNIPTALFWPKGGGVHKSGEWVSVKSLERFYKIIYNFLENF